MISACQFGYECTAHSSGMSGFDARAMKGIEVAGIVVAGIGAAGIGVGGIGTGILPLVPKPKVDISLLTSTTTNREFSYACKSSHLNIQTFAFQ